MASGDVPAEAELGDFDLLIVDGFNALGSRPDGWWRDRPAAMEGLVAELGTLARERPGLEVEVCFDGRPHERVVAAAARAGIGVSFAGPGADAADRMIAARVRERSAEAAGPRRQQRPPARGRRQGRRRQQRRRRRLRAAPPRSLSARRRRRGGAAAVDTMPAWEDLR